VNAATGSRIAVVGNGPRALWALERLDAHLERGGALPPSALHVFGRGDLGAGRVYDTSQPDYLRLNVASSGVDAWRGEGARGPCYDDWREKREPGSTRDAFPPRALTGVYLREQADRVLTSLRSRLGCEVWVHDELVARLDPSEAGWMVEGHGLFDEVLVTVGHAADWLGALHHDWPMGLPPLHPSVFPTADLLMRPELRAGATVVVRGAALTAVDAVLALTLGRGHRPANSDLSILLTSRTGRLMLPKTAPHVLAPLIAQLGDLTVVRGALAAGDDVPTLLGEVAVRLLGNDRTADELVGNAAEALLHRDDEHHDPLVSLRHGVAMARGQQPPDGAWALGQAWRILYPDLVRRQRTTTTGPPLGWSDYPGWSSELERLAFGPPLVNAELLLEGLESGTVRVRRGEVNEFACVADLVVDAVLPPPGIAELPAADLLGRLRDAGLLSRDPARRGARVADDASVIDAAGARVPGLALAGRVTEDDVLGNDTLIRDLHPELDRWAHRVLSMPTQETA
jgi:diaminopimelate decarboxylase